MHMIVHVLFSQYDWLGAMQAMQKKNSSLFLCHLALHCNTYDPAMHCKMTPHRALCHTVNDLYLWYVHVHSFSEQLEVVQRYKELGWA